MEHDIADIEVRCAAYDTDLAAPIRSRDIDEPQGVGVGVRLVMKDACRAHACDSGTRSGDSLDLETGCAQSFDEFVEREVDVDHRGEP
jgi:hypothetical protein